MSTTATAEAGGTTSTTPYLVVSSDTHIGPRVVEDLRQYCPANRLEEFDDSAKQLIAIRDRLLAYFTGGQGVTFRNFRTEGHFDPHARLRDMDQDGVAAEAIFHGSQNGEGLPFHSGARRTTPGAETRNAPRVEPDYELLELGFHIYNHWLADFCSVEPERHVGLAHLPMWDIPSAIKEVEWCREAGLRGVNFPAPKAFIKPYNLPDWEPFWSACEDLGVTLSNHGGAGAGNSLRGPAGTTIMKAEANWLSRMTPTNELTLGGVFERHPRLHLVLTEIPGTWWSQVMVDLDSLYLADIRTYGAELEQLCPRLPSEYAAENVFIGASFHAHFEAEDAIEKGYVRNVLWGSDYPHAEGTYQDPEGLEIDEPMTRLAQRSTYAGLPREEVGWMLGENAIGAYGLDRDALEKVAARINAPTYDDLNRPLDAVPAGAGHLAFRTFGPWT